MYMSNAYSVTVPTVHLDEAILQHNNLLSITPSGLLNCKTYVQVNTT